MGKLTGITLFTGGGGVEMGLGGLVDFVAGFELDQAIASHAETVGLGGEIICGDVRHVSFHRWRGVDYVHASPPCTRATIANKNKGETTLDVELGQAVLRCVDEVRPRFFSLENVAGYAKFDSYIMLVNALLMRGYRCRSSVVDAADYGTPQHRKRLILLASLEHQPEIPEGTHGIIFHPYIGWLEAVEDLLHTCPPSQLAPWQVARLTAKYGDKMGFDALMRVNGQSGDVAVPPHHPAPALTADGCGKFRAMIVGGGGLKNSIPSALGGAPSFVIKATTREPHRVVLVEGQSKGERPPSLTPRHAPSPPASGTGGGNVNRIVSEGGVFRLTTRCLARLQGFPDSYPLPISTSLATKIIGNSVPPPLAMGVIGKGLLSSVEVITANCLASVVSVK